MTSWDEPDEHGRLMPPAAAPEMDMVEAFLDFHRATLLWKVDGVSDEDLRRPMVPIRDEPARSGQTLGRRRTVMVR